MKEERQHKMETSRVIQSKGCEGGPGFVDNRPYAITQAKLINGIWQKEKNKMPFDKNNQIKNHQAIQLFSIKYDHKSFEKSLITAADQTYPILKGRRIPLLANFTNSIEKHLQENELSIKEKYGEFDSVTVISTASDYHKGATHVVQINFCLENEIVYTKMMKMRELTAEYELSLFFKDAGLPFYAIDADLHMEDYVKKSSTISNEIKPETLISLGKIAAFSMVMGLGDLHRDNLILSEIGPIAIDAEFAFNLEIILKTLNNPMFVSTVGGVVSGDNRPLGSFWAILKELGYNPKNITAEVKAHVFKGFTQGLDFAKGNYERIAGMLNRISSVRLAPLSTGYLAERLSESKDDLDKEVETVALMVEGYFSEKSGKVYMLNNLNMTDLKNSIKSCFTNGDIPYFTFNPQTGTISIDGVVFCSTKTNVETLLEHIKKKVSDLSTTEDFKDTLFPPVVDDDDYDDFFDFEGEDHPLSIKLVKPNQVNEVEFSSDDESLTE